MIKKVFMMILAAALMALPAVAQNYGTSHKPTYNRNGMQQMEATIPSSSFQSTSAMSGSGSSYSANPTLNSDGTATYNTPSYAPGGKPYKSPPSVGDPDEEGQGGTETRPDDPNPLGDAVLPLMLMALAFCAVTYLRRKKTVKS